MSNLPRINNYEDLVNLSKNTKVFHQPFNYKNGDDIELVKFTIAQDCKNLKEVVFR